MFFWGSIITLIAGGIAGYWFGWSQAKARNNRLWMISLDSAVTDNIIDEQQRTDIIRIQEAKSKNPNK
jgi:hypothetical protein